MCQWWTWFVTNGIRVRHPMCQRGRWALKGVDTGWCASEDVEPQRGVDCEILHRLETGTSISEDAGLRRGWIVTSHIGQRGDRNILYKDGETSPKQTCFKNLEGKPERDNPKKTISTMLG